MLSHLFSWPFSAPCRRVMWRWRPTTAELWSDAAMTCGPCRAVPGAEGDTSRLLCRLRRVLYHFYMGYHGIVGKAWGAHVWQGFEPVTGWDDVRDRRLWASNDWAKQCDDQVKRDIRWSSFPKKSRMSLKINCKQSWNFSLIVDKGDA